ncbi:hypothetical protein KFK09_003991 [Dendrobium nobile]|uniref:Reverse transcriptase domain-containing protein n=1 Tax=Dendrobium nobile TaxID=94219 RepID=A0A8T3C1P5_DENNO|nr:hypothetical protein KFK09_003991 [Dendrobium nobile]
MIDGNMFQWRRREFRRICVPINMDTQLPLGVWVEGSTGKFFQKLEYKRLPNLCFECGKLGHLKKDYKEKTLGEINVPAKANLNQREESINTNKRFGPTMNSEKTNEGYGPWLLVNYGKKRYRNFGFRKFNSGCTEEQAFNNTEDNLVEEGEIVDSENNLETASRDDMNVLNTTNIGCMVDNKEDEMKKVNSSIMKRKGKWRIASIYGNKDVYKRSRIWERLEFYSSKDLPMVLGGDINCILSKEDKMGGKRFLFSLGPKEMKSFLALNDLHEVGYVAPKLTWCNNKKGGDRILERLGRCFLNSAAFNFSHRLVVRHLARVASDHFPVILNLLVLNSTKKFLDLKRYGLSTRLRWLLSKAKHLSIVKKKEDLLKHIEELQSKEANAAKMDTWWRQRAKVKWLNEGDRNSRFFQAYASARRNSNYIAKIKDENGEIVEDQHQIEEVMIQFFKNKWKYRSCNLQDLPAPWKMLKNGDRDMFNKAFTIQEMEDVIKSSGCNISPGNDGITFAFFKAYWEIIKLDFWNAINYLFQMAFMDPKWKETIIVLSSRINNPLSPNNFRPIGLCNSVYKLAAKMLMNRLSPCIPKLISSEQDAFVKARTLSEHVLVAQKIMHKFKISKFKKGLVAFKIDIEQAYDSVEWQTLEMAMEYFGFPTRFVNLTMECLNMNGPSISHLLYANDLFFFSETNLKNIKEIKIILENFCGWSGQRINTTKSCMIFGKSIKRTRKKRISQLMWFKVVKEMYYLGIKLSLRRLKREDFHFIIEKAIKMTNCTNSLVPKSILDEVDKICRNFIWNKVNGSQGGVFRNHKGSLLLAFGKTVLHWDISVLEFMATQIIKEMMKDWMFKFKGIIIEGDNVNVIENLQKAMTNGDQRYSAFSRRGKMKRYVAVATRVRRALGTPPRWVGESESCREISNFEKVNKILRCLTSSYDTKITVITEYKDLNMYSIDNLLGSLIAYEQGVSQRQSDAGEKKGRTVALKANNSESDCSAGEEEVDIALMTRQFKNFLKRKLRNHQNGWNKARRRSPHKKLLFATPARQRTYLLLLPPEAGREPQPKAKLLTSTDPSTDEKLQTKDKQSDP